MIIDAWAQHPTARHIQDPIFDSLRRWTRGDGGGSLQRAAEMPRFETQRNMDAAGVSLSLISAWVGPKGALISNDKVAGFVKEAPDRLIGVGSVDISRPMEAVREIRRCKKVLFGTNWPMLAPGKALEGLDALGLDAEARELFLAGNAVRVFKLNAAQ
jgi:predicted TIM-barrel fold metal-dependent hydrolase